MAIEGARFGNATAVGKNLLRAIDEFCVHAASVVDAVAKVKVSASRANIPIDLLHKRLERLKGMATTVLKLAGGLDQP